MKIGGRVAFREALFTPFAKSLGKGSLALLLLGLLLLAPSYSLADHSRGNRCIACHTLRSTSVVAGSRNVLSTEVYDSLYQDTTGSGGDPSQWYCGGEWISSASTQPLDCSYCHKADIAEEFFVAASGVGSAHPVDVRGDNAIYTAGARIICNDCHSGGNVSPETACSKSDTDGYPNHINIVQTGLAPGQNDLTVNKPSLSYPYGPMGSDSTYGAGEVDWAKSAPYQASDLLCFICHDGDSGTSPTFSTIDENSMVDIMGDYNAQGGGHNVPGSGIGVGEGANKDTKRLACYHCHDPHGATIVSSGVENEKLVLNLSDGKQFPFSEFGGISATNPNTFAVSSSYVKGEDIKVCGSCHNGSTYVEDQLVMDYTDTTNLVFGFHDQVHAGNPQTCLMENGGCHQSAHNTNFFACLDCHSASTPYGPITNAKLLAVANVDSEMGHIGNVNDANILSQHNIVYNDTADLSLTANNGCLSCHNVSGTAFVLGNVVAVDGVSYAKPLLTGRADLGAYDNFCIGCHDGSNNAGESWTGLIAPKVNKFFYTAGHGASSLDARSSRKPDIGCLECHMYHGSTAYKLLPGDKQTLDGAGKVVKGFAYTSLTTATTYSIGGVSDSTKIDYIDYTQKDLATDGNSRLPDNKTRAFKFADYTNSSAWNTYYESTGGAVSSSSEPQGTEVFYGTSGDMLDTGQVNCGQDATSATAIGFCNACHFYSDTTNGTDETYGWVYTHEAEFGGADCDTTNYNSKRTMHKDCTECHDPHGSGDSSGSDTDYNEYMVRGKVTTAYSENASDATTYNVIFRDTGGDGVFIGDNGLDEDDGPTESNSDDICAVCHTRTDHNNVNNSETTSHPQGGDCTHCHDHGNTIQSSNKAMLGFEIDMIEGYTDCLDCHDGSEPLTGNKPLEPSDGIANIIDSGQYSSSGHGLPDTSSYPGLNEDGSGSYNSGANFVDGTAPSGCTNCHDDSTPHFYKSATDPYRLGLYATDTDGLCNSCHYLGADQTYVRHMVKIHDKTITESDYTWPGPNYSIKCVDCHDPHGDDNHFMIRSHIAAPDSATDTIFASNNYGTPRDTVNLKAVTVNTQDPANHGASGYYVTTGGDGICEACHNQTIYYASGGGADETHMSDSRCADCHPHKDGFKASGCSGCHGFPPLPSGAAGGAVPPEENYSGGGGPHEVHVKFLAALTGAQYPAVNQFATEELCGPCHNDFAGKVNHNQSINGIDPWPNTARSSVQIAKRSASMDSWGTASPLYNTSAVTDSLLTTATPPGVAMDETNSRCISFDCHGTDDVDDSTGVVNWYVTTAESDTKGYSGPGDEDDGQLRSMVCKGCHAVGADPSTAKPTVIRVWNSSVQVYGITSDTPTPTYTYEEDTLEVADNYFGTLSGMGRGGHGDAEIQNEDPFTDSSSLATPLDCTVCHDPDAEHFPPFTGSNTYRLLNTNIEDGSHNGLCNDCHDSSFYPGPFGSLQHHPSYDNNGAVTGMGKVLTNVADGTTWDRVYIDPADTDPSEPTARYEQSAYGAGGSIGALDNEHFYTTHPDRSVDWWDGTPGKSGVQSSIEPSFWRNTVGETPVVVLPLEKDILGSGSSTVVMCVTCHNPHGTDLRVWIDVMSPGLENIPDNNMLRLRDSDNTLCNACH
ncbi:MAG: hypothetical protein C0608_05095 [Deltaproteobacteria bacterium]|nr:MAG: hypothetical protein C0608_05095 [Deltaproteobacteria bacterium]